MAPAPRPFPGTCLLTLSILALLSGVSLVVAPPAVAGGGDQAWVRQIVGPGDAADDPVVAAVSPDGARVFVAGITVPSGSSDDYLTRAFDAATGSKLWRRTYNGPGDGIDMAKAIGTSPDGSTVYVTGFSLANNGAYPDYDFATIAYDAASGAVRWIARFDSPRSRNDLAYALSVSPDGSTVFVAGYGDQVNGRSKDIIVAYAAASGSRRWVSAFAGQHDVRDEIHDMTISHDGKRLFVTGLSSTQGSAEDYLTLAFNAGTGAMEWSARYNGPAHKFDDANAIAAAPDGDRVFVTGESDDVGMNDASYATVAYDATTGAALWETRHAGAALGEGAQDVAVAPDGGHVFVVGSTRAPNGYLAYDTLAYSSSTGDTVWEVGYHSTIVGDNWANAEALSPDGSRLYVTGIGADSHFQPASQFATAAYDTGTGRAVWGRVFDSPGQQDDDATDVAVSPDGTGAYVLGHTSAFGSPLYGWLVAYGT
jgi:hypothetical protein